MAWFAGSENMILNMVHVVETFSEVKEKKDFRRMLVQIKSVYKHQSDDC